MDTAAAIRISFYFSFIQKEKKVPLSNAKPAFAVLSGVGPNFSHPSLGTTAKIFQSLGARAPVSN
jgi:hypothetical protein